MSEIMERATELAERNTPAVAVMGLGELIETVFLKFFAFIGWMLGRTWFHGSRIFYFTGLAFADGYKKGARVPPPSPAPQAVPLQQPPVGPNQPNLIEQEFGGPLGVPYGPNVHAWAEKG